MFPKCRHCGHELHEHDHAGVTQGQCRVRRTNGSRQHLVACPCPGYQPAEDTGRARLKIA